jgi:transaldolase
MQASLLDQLRTMTTVVADTGDLAAIERARPQDATTNPSLILAAARMPAYAEVVRAAVRAAVDALPGATEDEVLAEATTRVAVEFGQRILALIPGRVSTEVDARLSYDTEKTLAFARSLIGRYETAGVSRERILIKIAATWEGIEAARVLEEEGIHCNLTLLFGLHQAIACAEAGVQLISPFVGRILDWYRASTGRDYPAAEDPGVLSVAQIYTYYKKFGYPTEVMGASFRSAGQIIELAGCDLLTIAPSLLEELEAAHGTLVRRLDPEAAVDAPIDRIEMTRDVFDAMHAKDRMATEKLEEGVRKFAEAAVELEELLRGFVRDASAR